MTFLSKTVLNLAFRLRVDLIFIKHFIAVAGKINFPHTFL